MLSIFTLFFKIISFFLLPYYFSLLHDHDATVYQEQKPPKSKNYLTNFKNIRNSKLWLSILSKSKSTQDQSHPTSPSLSLSTYTCVCIYICVCVCQFYLISYHLQPSIHPKVNWFSPNWNPKNNFPNDKHHKILWRFP